MKTDFEIFRGKVQAAYRFFWTWRSLQRREYNRLYKRNPNFFHDLLWGTHTGFISELCKLFEKQNPSFDVIVSVFTICPSFSIPKKEGEIIDRLKTFRNKLIMHNDKQALQDIPLFAKRLGLKNGEVEKLFKMLVSTLELMKPKNDITDYSHYMVQISQQCGRDVKSITKRLK